MCKELVDYGSCDDSFISNSSECICKWDKSCNRDEYLGYREWKCKRRRFHRLLEQNDDDDDDDDDSIIESMSTNSSFNIYIYIYIYIYISDCFAYIILLFIKCLCLGVVVCSYCCYYRYIKRYSRDVLPYKLVSMVKKVMEDVIIILYLLLISKF